MNLLFRPFLTTHQLLLIQFRLLVILVLVVYIILCVKYGPNAFGLVGAIFMLNPMIVRWTWL